jgi:hypothetical protein
VVEKKKPRHRRPSLKQLMDTDIGF